VNNHIVTSIVSITDESLYPEYAKNAQAAIDIEFLTPQPQIGWTFDGSILAPPPGYMPPNQLITKLAFRQRFTFSELIAIETATQNNVALRVLKDNLNVATFIDLTRPDTAGAMGILISSGLITPERANVILTTPPTASEIYIK
jgi:hypothetical protein